MGHELARNPSKKVNKKHTGVYHVRTLRIKCRNRWSLRSSETSLNPTVSVAWVWPLLPIHSAWSISFKLIMEILLTRWPRIQPILRACSVSIIPGRPGIILFQFSKPWTLPVDYLDKNYSLSSRSLAPKSLVAGTFVLFILFIAKIWLRSREQLPPGPPALLWGTLFNFLLVSSHSVCTSSSNHCLFNFYRCSLILNAQIHRMGISYGPSFLSVAFQPPEYLTAF